MSLLEELNAVLTPLIPIETGVFSGTAPDRYMVITPIVEAFELYADDKPHHEVQEARLSLFTKGSYTQIKNRIVRALLAADITISDRRYIAYDNGYHHFTIDVAKDYTFELEE